jgi:hypothetical protein
MSRCEDEFKNPINGRYTGNVYLSHKNLPLQICKSFEYDIIKLCDLDLTNFKQEEFKILLYFKNMKRSDADQVSKFLYHHLTNYFLQAEKTKRVKNKIQMSARYGGSYEIFSNWDLVIWPFTKYEVTPILQEILDRIKQEYGVN